MNTIGARMRTIREELNLSQRDLADLAKVSQSTIGNVEAGLRDQPRKLNAIAEILGVNPLWLETGKGPIRNEVAKSEDAQFAEPREEDYCLIPIYSTYGSCGNGFLNDNIEIIGNKVFSKGLARKLNLDTTMACFINAAGDSMYPYIADGDEVLIDRRVTPTRTGEIYAIMIDGEVFIKRLAREFGSLFLRSDNPNKSMYPDMHVPQNHDLTIIGRVVWRGG